MARQRDPKLRASDADRDAVAEQLREHYATGRLSMADLDQRLDRVYAAQTYGELEPLVEDLPGPGPYSDLPIPFPGPSTGAPVPAGPGWHPHPLQGWSFFAAHHRWGAWGSASAACWGVWLASAVSGGGVAGVWPVWVTVPWGGVLLAQAVGERNRSDHHRSDHHRNDHHPRRLE